MKFSLLFALILLAFGFFMFLNDRLKNTYLDESSLYVAEIIDGDTLTLSNEERVRLIGIDSPEIHKECFASESKEILKKQLASKKIRLERDKDPKDRFDRSLYYIWVDEKLLNLEMVALGAARSVSYPPNVKYQEILNSAEVNAKISRIGLWGCKK